ncbi:MAG: tRNA (adenosine(37)-N6)-threonylcarbamoyltransferase complex ATPase subunit type 1 TsaE [Alphaproteobacteria bacterium]|nr:tRNA (adenosine(37)-N6)-threonylcarbamoyltransferase complex ATPase subunit type 1 TsaE [Alphaproteobacteria bacterium]
MSLRFACIHLADEAATTAVARQIAPRLRAGDTLLLEGPIGAGKTTFARALIRARLGQPEEDVPSPTFTLVQTYQADDVEIWHCDLYRLLDSQDVLELGLDDAFATAICLIEWPDRLGADRPAEALVCAFAASADHHSLSLTGAAAWQSRLDDLHD